MDQAITRAAGAAPRAVGEFQGYVDGQPSIVWADRKNMPQVGDKLFALPRRAAVSRSWSILLTSANHGVVGPVGSQFPHAGENHERVLVVEVPAAAGAPSDQVNLVLRSQPTGIPVAAAERQDAVERALKAAQAWANEEYVCGRNMGKGGPGTHAACDAKQATCLAAIQALAAPVAAQAGQVAVPEGWKLVPIEPTLDMVTHGFESAPDEFFSPGEDWDAYAEMTGCQKAAHRAKLCWAAMLAAAPAAPAQAKPLPGGQVRIADLPRIEITLRQAKELVETFGGHDAEISVFRRPAAWADMADGLYAFFSEYPDEGSIYLGPTEVDDELAMNGEPPSPEEGSHALTDLSQRMRAAATADVGMPMAKLLIGGAEEIERYYGGMMAWKKTAEKKDRDWQAERMERVNERCAARAQASTAGGCQEGGA